MVKAVDLKSTTFAFEGSNPSAVVFSFIFSEVSRWSLKASFAPASTVVILNHSFNCEYVVILSQVRFYIFGNAEHGFCIVNDV